MRRRTTMTREEAAALLGVPVDADERTVRHAWRMWARLAHPDVGGDPAHFNRLDQARRLLLGPRPIPTVPLPEPAPRASWADVVHRPDRPRLLSLAAVFTVLLAVMPSFRSPAEVAMTDLVVLGLPAAIAAAGWAAWAARSVLSDRADLGHRMAALPLAWLPIAAAQLVVSWIAGASLLPVLPLLALPLVAAVSAVNPGAGLWRGLGDLPRS